MGDIPSLWDPPGRAGSALRGQPRLAGREEFLTLALRVPVRTEVEPYPLQQAGEALDALTGGRVGGAAVLVVHGAMRP